MDESILKIVEYLEDQRSDLLEMIETVVNMDSPSSDKSACDRLIRYLAEVSSSIADKIEIVPMTEYGDCLMATVGSGNGQVLVLSHLLIPRTALIARLMKTI
ncbi:MAG: hypothetical protein C4530_11665 [Desulfobacteraceae bacterium]|nr:MAG: hypothetical protein C4530_11665 [Desulfobacteraceae bacterium]